MQCAVGNGRGCGGTGAGRREEGEEGNTGATGWKRISGGDRGELSIRNGGAESMNAAERHPHVVVNGSPRTNSTPLPPLLFHLIPLPLSAAKSAVRDENRGNASTET